MAHEDSGDEGDPRLLRDGRLPGDGGARVPGDGGPRLSGDERRRQLVGVGLRLLTTTPIHEMSLDQVATEAGISRSVLFHHFPTRRDFIAAVVRAASRRILREVDESIATDPRPVYGLVDGLLTFIERRRDPYLAFVRGASGGDAWVLEIYEETRSRLADRTLTALAGDFANADPLQRMAVRGWLALAEEMSLEWTLDPRLEREQLLDLLVEALHGVVALVPPLPSAR
jgi:AcrR family transcriptional regulator